MINSNSTEKKNAAAYTSFLTFRNFVESLHETACPPTIDRSVMTTISGGNQASLLASLGFLNLIQGGRVTELMKRVVTSYNTDSWEETLGTVIADAYLDIVESVDLGAGTYKQLRDAFKRHGQVDGPVLDRAIRFYLAAQRNAGITLSPHFKKPRASAPSLTKRGKKNTGGAKPPPVDKETPSTPSDYTEFPLRGGRKIIVPTDLTQNEVRTITQYLTAFVGVENE